MSKEQANAAAQALMEVDLKRQEDAKAVLDKKQTTRRFPPIRWLVLGAIVGLVTGAILEFIHTRSVSYWGVVGVGMGMAIGSAFDAD